MTISEKRTLQLHGMLTIKYFTVRAVIMIAWIVLISTEAQCQDMKVLRLRATVPILLPEYGVQNFGNDYIRYESDSIIVYGIPVSRSYSEVTVNKNVDVIRDTLIAAWEDHKYFVFKKGSATGLLYDSVNVAVAKTARVDSIFSINNIFTFNKFLGRKMLNDRLVKSWWSPDSSRLIESYVPIIKKDKTYSDSTILYYTRELDKINYSLSDSLDHVKGIKLYWMNVVYNGDPKSPHPFWSKARQTVFKMEEISIDYGSDILQIISRFRKEIAIE